MHLTEKSSCIWRNIAYWHTCDCTRGRSQHQCTAEHNLDFRDRATKENHSPFAQGNISQILGEKMTALQFALQTETQSGKTMQMVTLSGNKIIAPTSGPLAFEGEVLSFRFKTGGLFKWTYKEFFSQKNPTSKNIKGRVLKHKENVLKNNKFSWQWTENLSDLRKSVQLEDNVFQISEKGLMCDWEIIIWAERCDESQHVYTAQRHTSLQPCWFQFSWKQIRFNLPQFDKAFDYLHPSTMKHDIKCTK